ncbi:hypothetical protein ABK040_016235 [Willaertia magna]
MPPTIEIHKNQYLYVSGKQSSISLLFSLLKQTLQLNKYNYLIPFEKEFIKKITGGITMFIFLTTENNIYQLNRNEFKQLNKNSLNGNSSVNFLNKGEKIIDISCLVRDILVLTNFGNVFELTSDNSAFIKKDFKNINNNLDNNNNLTNNNLKFKYICQGYQSSFVISECDQLFVWGNAIHCLGREIIETNNEMIYKITKFEPPLQYYLQNNTENNNTLQTNNNNEKIIEIISDTSFTFFLTSFGHVYSCGRDDSFVLGHYNCENVLIPTRIESLLNEFIVSVKTGQSTALLLTRDYKVYLLGKNYLLNDPTPINHLPVNITLNIITKNLNDFVTTIHCGNQHYVFVTASGKIVAAGMNKDNQLGIDMMSDVEHTLNDGDVSYSNNLEFAKEVSFDVLPPNYYYCNGCYKWSIFGNYNSTFLLAEKKSKDLNLFFNKLSESVKQKVTMCDVTIYL